MGIQIVKTNHTTEPRHPARVDVEREAAQPDLGLFRMEEHVDSRAAQSHAARPENQAAPLDLRLPRAPASDRGEPSPEDRIALADRGLQYDVAFDIAGARSYPGYFLERLRRNRRKRWGQCPRNTRNTRKNILFRVFSVFRGPG